MGPAEPSPPGPASSEPTISDLAADLLADLAAGGYSREAWKAFFGRAYRHAVDANQRHPERTRSFFRWAGFGAAIGVAFLGLPVAVAEGAGAQDWSAAPAIGWAIWYAVVAYWTWLHLGLARADDDAPFQRLHWPNGLSFLRLSLAPLVIAALAGGQTHGLTAKLCAGLIVALALSDLLDGQIARATARCSRLGRALDPLADVAFLAALSLGLQLGGILPTAVLVLVLLRYPGTFVVTLVLVFVRGPMAIQPTIVGKATSAVVSTGMTLAALAVLLRPAWLAPPWLRWGTGLLAVPLALNLVYLIGRAYRWRRHPAG
ncbi:MAG: CDP-alcohol phosphatidyltransferase family protein [Deltaproteobacteria bacterium]|nr:CDP-alcohol phosphatidyltransferase family protein [Deltaproteobacteria bacterium]